MPTIALVSGHGLFWPSLFVRLRRVRAFFSLRMPHLKILRTYSPRTDSHISLIFDINMQMFMAYLQNIGPASMTDIMPPKTPLAQRIRRAWNAMSGGFIYRSYVVLIGIGILWIVLLCTWKIGGSIIQYISSSPDFLGDVGHIFDVMAGSKIPIHGTDYPTWLCLLLVSMPAIILSGETWELIGKTLVVLYRVGAATIKPMLFFIGIWLLIAHPLHFIALAVALLAWVICDWCAKNTSKRS